MKIFTLFTLLLISYNSYGAGAFSQFCTAIDLSNNKKITIEEHLYDFERGVGYLSREINITENGNFTAFYDQSDKVLMYETELNLNLDGNLENHLVYNIVDMRKEDLEVKTIAVLNCTKM